MTSTVTFGTPPKMCDPWNFSSLKTLSGSKTSTQTQLCLETSKTLTFLPFCFTAVLYQPFRLCSYYSNRCQPCTSIFSRNLLHHSNILLLVNSVSTKIPRLLTLYISIHTGIEYAINNQPYSPSASVLLPLVSLR